MADASQAQQVQLTPAQLDVIRTRAEASLFYFARAVLGYTYLTEEFHGGICDFVTSPALRKLIILARGHFKTTIATISYPLWRALRDPNIRILIVNATATNAEKFLASIKWHVENNGLVRALWPAAVPDTKKVRWSSDVAELRRSRAWQEGTFEAIGVGGAVASRHYDLIIKDDLVDLSEEGDDADVPELVARAINWHQYSKSLFVNAENGEDVVIGTRWGRDDFLAHVENTEGEAALPGSPRAYRKLQRAALEHGRPVFPRSADGKHGFTEGGLAELRITLRPYKFSGQYLLDPCDPSVAEFKPQWLRYWQLSDGGRFALEGTADRHGDPLAYGLGGLNIYAAVDPGLSRKRKSDPSGVVVVGAGPAPYKLVLEATPVKADPLELIEALIALNRRWHPIAVGIEAVAAQKLFKPFLEFVARTRNVFIPVREFRTDTQVSKSNRIRALVPEFAHGHIFVGRHMTELIAEYTGFPSMKDQHMLDALAYAPQIWTEADDPEDAAADEADMEMSLSGRNPLTGY